MKISDLIKELDDKRTLHGDLDIGIHSNVKTVGRAVYCYIKRRRGRWICIVKAMGAMDSQEKICPEKIID